MRWRTQSVLQATNNDRRRDFIRSVSAWGFVDCVENLLLSQQELNEHSQFVLVQHSVEKVQSQLLSVISNVGLHYLYGAEFQQRFIGHSGFRSSTGWRLPVSVRTMRGCLTNHVVNTARSIRKGSTRISGI